jgi:hypothetical protein
VEESLIEMYLAGVRVRRVEDITQALWGTRVSASTMSDLNEKVYKQIGEWRQQINQNDWEVRFSISDRLLLASNSCSPGTTRVVRMLRSLLLKATPIFHFCPP